MPRPEINVARPIASQCHALRTANDSVAAIRIIIPTVATQTNPSIAREFPRVDNAKTKNKNRNHQAASEGERNRKHTSATKSTSRGNSNFASDVPRSYNKIASARPRYAARNAALAQARSTPEVANAPIPLSVGGLNSIRSTSARAANMTRASVTCRSKCMRSVFSRTIIGGQLPSYLLILTVLRSALRYLQSLASPPNHRNRSVSGCPLMVIMITAPHCIADRDTWRSQPFVSRHHLSANGHFAAHLVTARWQVIHFEGLTRSASGHKNAIYIAARY